MSKLDNLLDFISFTHDVRDVDRSMWVRGEEQFENDSEHSFQLAMVAMYLIEHDKLELDVYRTMAMALVHDILEVHSGDTYIYGAPDELASKADREAEAIVVLKKQWPKFTLMHELIDEYEARKTPESKFVYALDKLLPMTNNYADNGRNWKRNAITIDQIAAAKAGKVSVDPIVNAYYQELMKRLQAHPEMLRSST